MNNVMFYVDDFNVVKLYIKNYLDKSYLETLKITENDLEIAYNLTQLDSYYDYDKYEIRLESELDINANHLFYIHNQGFKPIYRSIVSKVKFDELYYYQGNDLGCTYTKQSSIFKLWSPLALKVDLILDHKRYSMTKKDSIFVLEIKQDLEFKHYQYELFYHHTSYIITDPYSYGSSTNATHSIVLDPSKFKRPLIKPQNTISSLQEAIIYELSVRDFTSHPSCNATHKYKLLGLIEEGLKNNDLEIGVDYLKSLGVSHIQIMPIFDFDSYDETSYPKHYNWGYDPKQYNVIEGSYISGHNAYDRIKELQMVVDYYHKHNIRVNLDVVFNHVYRVENVAFNGLVPYYFFRYMDDEQYSNGSYCGNEIRSEAKMMRKYLIDMCKRYVELFDIDGLRFDLMGLTDLETMKIIQKELTKLKKDFVVYGEGWQMPSILDYAKQSTIYNNYQLENIGFFNDYYRETLAGSLINLDFNNYDFQVCLKGSTENGKFKHNHQSLNYIECHDNHTFYDRLSHSKDYDHSTKAKICELALKLLALSKGPVFIHSGQEFLRTKKGVDNTYNLDDSYNSLDWDLLVQNKHIVDSFKEILKFRNNNMRYLSNTDYYFENINNVNKIKIGYFNVYFNGTFEYQTLVLNQTERLIYHKCLKDQEVNQINLESFDLIITKD